VTIAAGRHPGRLDSRDNPALEVVRAANLRYSVAIRPKWQTVNCISMAHLQYSEFTPGFGAMMMSYYPFANTAHARFAL